MLRHKAQTLLLIGCNTVVWTLNLLIYNGNIQLSARSGIPISIESEPLRVRMSINGKQYDGSGSMNGWIDTPTILKVPSGTHRILLERPGYAPHSFKMVVNETDNPPIRTVMEENSDHLSEVELKGDHLEDLSFTIDDGVEKGEFPHKSEKMMPGVHTLEISFKGIESLRTKPYLCKFQVPQGEDGPYVIQIIKNGKRIKSPQCKRSK